MNDNPSNAEMPVPIAPAESHHLLGEELVQAHALILTRTKSAVRVRIGDPPYQHEVWVSAGAARVLTGDTADNGRPNVAWASVAVGRTGRARNQMNRLWPQTCSRG